MGAHLITSLDVTEKWKHSMSSSLSDIIDRDLIRP